MSNINSNIINENFPIAGQDNDTQVFRDNFSAIKDNFSIAKTEIQDLQDETARIDQANNFQNNLLEFAVLRNVGYFFRDMGVVSTATEISLSEAGYFKFGVDGPVSLNFRNFPSTQDVNRSVGLATIEINAVGTDRTITLLEENGIVFKKKGTFTGNTFVVSANTTVILEVWQYDNSTIFVHNLGVFE